MVCIVDGFSIQDVGAAMFQLFLFSLLIMMFYFSSGYFITVNSGREALLVNGVILAASLALYGVFTPVYFAPVGAEAFDPNSLSSLVDSVAQKIGREFVSGVREFFWTAALGLPCAGLLLGSTIGTIIAVVKRQKEKANTL